MTKRYSILQSKLHELESILDDLLLHGPETQSHDSLSKDIKQKIAFIRNLLSAEVASHPSKPHHLQHISHRLATLEKAFHDWDTYRTLSYEELDKDSTCSCTESCLNDDGEALHEAGLVVFEDPEELFHDHVGDKALVEFNGSVVETQKNKVGFDKLASFVYEDAEEFFEGFGGDEELVEFNGGLLRKGEEEWKDVRPERKELESDVRRGSACGKKCCAGACGFVFGMFLMGFIMVTLSGCFHHSVEQASFTVPT